MTSLHALLLGIVEGITEFLPISSTGHLILSTQLLGLSPTEFVKSFEIAIQLGAIGAVLFLYPKELFVELVIMRRVAVAFLPTAVIGAVLYKIVKTYFLESALLVVWSLALGGIALIAFERLWAHHRVTTRTIETLSYRRAAMVGLMQSVSMIPGVSRAAATIVGGMFVGLSREGAVKFSFLLAVPTMAAATTLDLIKSVDILRGADMSVFLIGFLTSFVVALCAITLLLRFVRTHDFTVLGIYRIIVAALFWIAILR